MNAKRTGLAASLTLVVVAASVILIAGVSQARTPLRAASAAVGGSPPGSLLDHFVCYHVTQSAGQPAVPGGVSLADEFSKTDATGKPVPTPVKVGAPVALCAPITKLHLVGTQMFVYPVLHPTLHLVCFRITENPPTPRFVVKTDNQFNPQAQPRILTTGNAATTVTATSVCLPSHKSIDPAVPPAGEPLNLLSHFKCYSAAETEPTGTTVPGLPAPVWGIDQFSPTPLPRMTVVAPVSLCNPAEKVIKTAAGQTVYPAVNPDLHLVCFSIRGGIKVGKPVTVDNQFNPPNTPRVLNVGAAFSLCAPSFKQIIPPPPG